MNTTYVMDTIDTHFDSYFFSILFLYIALSAIRVLPHPDLNE